MASLEKGHLATKKGFNRGVLVADNYGTCLRIGLTEISEAAFAYTTALDLDCSKQASWLLGNKINLEVALSPPVEPKAPYM